MGMQSPLGPKEDVRSPGTEVQAVVSPHVLGIEPWPSGRTTSTFDLQIISPAPIQIFKYVYERLKDLTLVKTKTYWF